MSSMPRAAAAFRNVTALLARALSLTSMASADLRVTDCPSMQLLSKQLAAISGSLRTGPGNEIRRLEICRVKFSGSSKVLLSSVLAPHLGCEPRDLRFGTGPFGKPELLQPCAQEPPNFSLSRCEGNYLIAVSFGGNVGVDLERPRLIGDLDRIADLYFTPAEGRTISALQDDGKLNAFFACWTFKEAYTKALGTGLVTPLDSFAFPRSAWTATNASCSRIGGREWTHLKFEPWPGFIAAVVVAGRLSPSAFHFKEAHVGHIE